MFTAQGRCTNPGCGEAFALGGTGDVVDDFDPEAGPSWADLLSPRFCIPMPDVIRIPGDCPGSVRAALRHAFSLLWTNPSACAGRLRVALEAVMDSRGIPKAKLDKRGRSRPVSLHSRIKALSDVEPSLVDQLIGVKWLGNAGSHDNQVDQESLLDGLEVLEYVLQQLIERPSHKLTLLANDLTARWGGEW